MSSLEDTFENACKDGTIPGVVLLAADKTGNFEYAKTFGVQNIEDPSQPMQTDGFMWMASCTKLMTSIAAMQLVERGRITLEDDVAAVLPELASQEILTGFDEDNKPLLKKRQNTITLRILLTHSSGATYEQTNPLLVQYRASRREKPGGSRGPVADLYNYPLVFEPGTSWTYGPSMDWAGLYVERVVGESLEDYMSKNIWGPLGIKDITFFPDARADMKSRLVSMTLRDPAGSGKVIPWQGRPIYGGLAGCHGGGGAFGSMPDFMKILKSLLANDEKLVKKGTLAQMFKPHLDDKAAEGINKVWSSPGRTALFIGTFPTDKKYDWGIGGLLIMDDIEGWRNKGTMIWSGLPNIFWTIDPTAGFCALYGSQVAPPGDLQSEALVEAFEKAMYKKARAARAKV